MLSQKVTTLFSFGIFLSGVFLNTASGAIRSNNNTITVSTDISDEDVQLTFSPSEMKK